MDDCKYCFILDTFTKVWSFGHSMRRDSLCLLCAPNAFMDAHLLLLITCIAPAIPYLDYETVKFATFSTESPYKGQPSPEIDAAWDKLDQGKDQRP